MTRTLRWFVVGWAISQMVKVALADVLPLFGDEAFYWQEGQHLAWAYSDLPGLTAWLTRLGVECLSPTPLSVRWPFLVLGAAIPWQVASIASRCLGEAMGRRAGWLALLMPLSATLGVLAVPDVPLTFASLICLDAVVRLLGRITWQACVLLAVGLTLGALSHYRFVAVIAAGSVGLLLSVRGRTVACDLRVWIAGMLGAVAWLPLILWNLAHGNSGLRFQLIDRHPWAMHADALAYPLVQGVLVTPFVAIALILGLHEAWKKRREDWAPYWALLLGVGGVLIVGYFLLGVVADSERVSFHWPLPGWLALAAAAPVVVARWSPGMQRILWTTLVLGSLVSVAALGALSSPSVRADMAGSRWYQDNFSGWSEIAAATARRLERMPPGRRLAADNFMLGAQLGFELRDADIAVLDHPLNQKHGRFPQLQLWGLDRVPRPPLLLVVEDSAMKLRDRLARYRNLCRVLGGLPPPQVVHVDHGRKRFLMFSYYDEQVDCALPGLAHIDTPQPGARTTSPFMVEGWAIKDTGGVARVVVTLDGQPVVNARYGLPKPDLKAFLPNYSDPNQPAVGFSAEIPRANASVGVHWLGLQLVGRDGHVEQWPEQKIVIEPSAGIGRRRDPPLSR